MSRSRPCRVGRRIRRLILLGSLGFILSACATGPDYPARDFREDMRKLVMDLSAQAQSQNPDFILVPQNGLELATTDGEADGPLAASYLAAIDGAGREDLFYGYDGDDLATPASERDWMLDFCRRFRTEGKSVLVIDYCSTPAKVDDSYRLALAEDFLDFAAPRRELDLVPAWPLGLEVPNAAEIHSLADARNFLYLINDAGYPAKQDFIAAVKASAYDLLILDLFHGGEAFTAAELEEMRLKPQGGRRLILAYLSIGEAEDYRYYWDPAWSSSPPDWLEAENPDWEGNYKVRYWDPAWRSILLGSGPGAADGYLDRILAAGFDGAYLDLIDAYEWFEDRIN